jgi:hypothetical protein
MVLVSKEQDLYGRTVMPPSRDPGNGPLTPLHIAARDGDIESLQQLLESTVAEAKVGIDCLAKFGWTPMMFAARHGHSEIVKLLLARGANVAAADHHRSTALHRAAHQNSVKTIEALVHAGADMEQVDRMGQTALHVAASNGCMAAAKCLVRLSASTMAKDGPLCDGMLPHQVADMWGETEVAEFLRKSMEQFQVDIKRASMSTDKAAKQWLEQVQLTLQAKH